MEIRSFEQQRREQRWRWSVLQEARRVSVKIAAKAVARGDLAASRYNMQLAEDFQHEARLVAALRLSTTARPDKSRGQQLGAVNGSPSAIVARIIGEAREGARVCALHGNHCWKRIHESYVRELVELELAIERTKLTANDQAHRPAGGKL